MLKVYYTQEEYLPILNHLAYLETLKITNQSQMHNTRFKKKRKCFQLPQCASGHTTMVKTIVRYIGYK